MDDVFLEEVALDGDAVWGQGIASDEVSLIPATTESEFDVLAVEMDISAPLSTLKDTLQQRLGADFSHCQFWLQDALQLGDNATLSEQCVQGVGLVQVNIELKSVLNIDRINILDVLKPSDEDTLADNQPSRVMGAACDTTTSDMPPESLPSVQAPAVLGSLNSLPTPVNVMPNSTQLAPVPAVKTKSLSNSRTPQTPLAATSSSENITRWVMDSNFKKDQEKMKIPQDPQLWTQVHVQYWIHWAINQFSLKGVNPTKWAWIDGPALCTMSHAEFMEKIPNDPNDLFWTHLELLRKCKFVGVIQKPVPYLQYVTTPLNVKGDATRIARPMMRSNPTKAAHPDTFAVGSAGGKMGSSGQVQLWQFLLELLTDKNAISAISWTGNGGEFKLNNPEMVAQLWGERKNKPNMNYEKLSRALRYYYDGDMICKVSGKRFVYKFVCDLKQLLGYTAEELNRQVTECAQRSRAFSNQPPPK